MAKQTTNTASLIFKIIKTSLIVILLTLAGSDNISRSSAARILIGGGGGILMCKGREVANRRGAKFAALRHCSGGKGWIFARFPKGGVIPPSGPSRRTNGDHY